MYSDRIMDACESANEENAKPSTVGQQIEQNISTQHQR